jgi:hypothetical protein
MSPLGIRRPAARTSPSPPVKHELMSEPLLRALCAPVDTVSSAR